MQQQQNIFLIVCLVKIIGSLNAEIVAKELNENIDKNRDF